MFQMSLPRLPRILWLPIFSLLAGGIGIGMLLGAAVATSSPSGQFLAVAVTVVGTASAFWTRRGWQRVFQLIDSATAAAQGIERGNLDQVLSDESPGQLGQLARAFNAMARHLRKEHELQNLEQSRLEQAWLAIVDCFPGPALVVDELGGVRAANDAAAQIWGLRHGDPKRIAVWRPPDEVLQPLADALRLGQAHLPQNFRHVVSLGTRQQERFFLPRIVPLFGERRCPLGAVVVFDDVTRFRLLDEMQRDFIAAVSHESRTPLTSIRLAVYLLLQDNVGQLNARQAELLTEIRDNAERLLAMIEDMLNHSLRLEHERSSDPVRQVTGNQLLQSVTLAIKELARKSNTAVVLEAEAGQLTTQLQVGRAVDSVYRLLEHSLRLREHPSRIVVRAEESDRWVTVSIRDVAGAYHADTSLGDWLPFRAFISVRKPGGYLNAVREMIETQGGELLMDEPSGQGTVFQLRFPVLSTETASNAAADLIAARRGTFEPIDSPAEAQTNDSQP